MTRTTKRSNKTKFVEEANKIHHNRYGYENFIYINNKTKGYITCFIHGEYLSSANNHLSKRSGCPFCADRKYSIRKTKNKPWFLEKAYKIHDLFYNYSKFVYIGINVKGIIICPKHRRVFTSSKRTFIWTRLSRLLVRKKNRKLKRFY